MYKELYNQALVVDPARTPLGHKPESLEVTVDVGGRSPRGCGRDTSGLQGSLCDSAFPAYSGKLASEGNRLTHRDSRRNLRRVSPKAQQLAEDRLVGHKGLAIWHGKAFSEADLYHRPQEEDP